jgi:hypothetical protein
LIRHPSNAKVALNPSLLKIQVFVNNRNILLPFQTLERIDDDISNVNYIHNINRLSNHNQKGVWMFNWGGKDEFKTKRSSSISTDYNDNKYIGLSRGSYSIKVREPVLHTIKYDSQRNIVDNDYKLDKELITNARFNWNETYAKSYIDNVGIYFGDYDERFLEISASKVDTIKDHNNVDRMLYSGDLIIKVKGDFGVLSYFFNESYYNDKVNSSDDTWWQGENKMFYIEDDNVNQIEDVTSRTNNWKSK